MLVWLRKSLTAHIADMVEIEPCKLYNGKFSVPLQQGYLELT